MLYRKKCLCYTCMKKKPTRKKDAKKNVEQKRSIGKKKAKQKNYFIYVCCLYMMTRNDEYLFSAFSWW